MRKSLRVYVGCMNSTLSLCIHQSLLLLLCTLIPQIFTTKFYVQKEIEYNFVSTQGSVNQSTLDGWEGYLEQYRDYIIKGTHFSNFAVQASLFI